MFRRAPVPVRRRGEDRVLAHLDLIRCGVRFQIGEAGTRQQARVSGSGTFDPGDLPVPGGG